MGKQKYSDEEKRKNLTAYLNAKGGTYRSFMSMLGESLANQIDLLAQLLDEAHHPTTGRYKETLLADLIAEFVPGRYSVGTGFGRVHRAFCRPDRAGNAAIGPGARPDGPRRLD